MIEIWHNRQMNCPSVQVGSIAIDLRKETPAQAELFKLVMNHPDVSISGAVRAPLTHEIASLFMTVLQEEIAQYTPKPPKKRMGHVVQYEKT